MTTRREFLSRAIGSSAVLSFAGTTPAFLQQAAHAGAGETGGRALVVVQLSGGNDGLNTIVPFTDDVYRSSRPKLRIAADDVLKIDKEYGFHPALTGFADLLESGSLGIVPSVGYPNPNRSHFESMDIWHTCRRKKEVRDTGWLGHYLEQTSDVASGELTGMHIGRDKQPLALAARRLRVPSLESLEQFRLETSGDAKLAQLVRKTLSGKSEPAENDLLGFLKTSTATAVAADKRLESFREGGKLSGFPDTRLGRELSTVARLIKADLPTRVYYVTHNGFDTHARQPGAHTSLLRQLGDAVAALVKDLRSAGQADRVLVLAFSEFGRRVAENASEGTDHGTAGPLFVAGGAVRNGFLGPHSDTKDLENGDLRFQTDFRSVYTSVLADWFGHKSAADIIGDKYPRVPLLNS